MQENHINITYPLSSRPGAAEILQVAAGIYWVRMPLPIPGLEHINLWLLEDGDGWTIIDTGMKNLQIRSLWEDIFGRYLDGKPVTRVLCTHFHPDHMGLAGWLVERWPDALLWCTLSEWAFGRMLWQDLKEPAPDTVRLFYHRLGWSEARIENYLERRYGWYSRAVEPIPRSLRRLQHNELFTIGRNRWRVSVGRGHSPEHACLYCEDLNVLIAGDQVLPKISPHIGVYPGEPDGNPLADYLASLETLRTLPQDALVLPSHGDPFYGLHIRLNALREHHAVRLERLYDACIEATVAADLIPAMFSRTLKEEDMSLATSEGLAHVHLLIANGRMRRELATDGVYRFRRTERSAVA
jgi:glyoxylase-like metal-dependent hydrolase (beta-lactamase superfamily II)